MGNKQQIPAELKREITRVVSAGYNVRLEWEHGVPIFYLRPHDKELVRFWQGALAHWRSTPPLFKSIGAGVWDEPLQYQYGWGWLRLFEAPFVAMDIGAYFGESALALAAHGANRVVAYEPQIVAASIARWNARNNGRYNNVQVIRGLVGTAQKPRVRVSYAPSGVATPDWNLLNGGGVEEYAPQYNAATEIAMIQPELVKIDCEGCEWDVLRHILLNTNLPLDAMPLAFVAEFHIPPSMHPLEVYEQRSRLLNAFYKLHKQGLQWVGFSIQPWRKNPVTDTWVQTVAFVQMRVYNHAIPRGLAQPASSATRRDWETERPDPFDTTFMQYIPPQSVSDVLYLPHEVYKEVVRYVRAQRNGKEIDW